MSAELAERGREELRSLSKSQAQEVNERLNMLEAQLQLAASGTRTIHRLPEYFLEVWYQSPDQTGDTQTRSWTPRLRNLGAPSSLSRLGPPSAVSLVNDPSGMLLMGVPDLGPSDAERSQALWAAIDTDRLWWGELRAPALPRGIDLTFFGSDQEVLQTTAPLQEQPVLARYREAMGKVDWSSNEIDQTGHFWALPLRRFVGERELTILASQPTHTLTAPMVQINIFFGIAALTSLLSILLISMVQLRRRLEPLSTLMGATQQISRREFSSPIEVSSDDELQELAESFNTMAGRLESQFRTLEASRDITRLVLSAVDERQLVTAALRRLGEDRACRAACLTLSRGENDAPPITYRLDERGRLLTERVSLPSDLSSSVDPRQHQFVEHSQDLPPFARPLRSALPGYLSVQIISMEARPAGVVSTLLEEDAPASEGDSSIDQLAELIGVALINLNQMRQLRGYSRQSLATLARAVDMKSAWTLGHSERVANLARAVGERLGLDADHCETLWRAGIVHDIGKISVPRTILDKPGPLDEQEQRVMQAHVTDGLRILEPLVHLAPALPFVREHHERLDGSGYPRGLIGSEITLDGRIAAVVDSFDALTSPRPYRKELSRTDALGELARVAGTQLDASVVAALTEVVGELDLRLDERRGPRPLRPGVGQDSSSPN